MNESINYLKVESVESIQDEFRLSKKKINGKTNSELDLTFYIDDWCDVKIGAKLKISKRINKHKVEYEILEDSFIHPIFQKNTFYKFVFLGEVFNNENGLNNIVKLKFRGIDNRVYTVVKINQIFTKNDIGKEFELKLVKIKNGNGIFHTRNIFYSIDSIKKIELIEDLFYQLETTEKTELELQVLEQYKNEDNRWVISFIRHLENRSWDYYLRKDWLTFHKYSDSIKKLQEWILSSKYLLLYRKEKIQDIQNVIKKQRQQIEIKEKSAQLYQSFKEIEFITSLKINQLKDSDYQLLSLLIRSNNELIIDKTCLSFFYDLIILENSKTELANIIIINVENKVYQLSKKIFSLNTIDGSKNLNEINQLLILYIFLYNVAVKLNTNNKIRIFQLRFCKILSLIKEFNTDEILILKRQLLKSKTKLQMFGDIFSYTPRKIFQFLRNLEVQDFDNECFSVGQKTTCHILSKSNFGILVKNEHGRFGILPKQQITKSRFDNIFENSEIDMVINYINNDINTFIPGFNKLDDKIENLFKENKNNLQTYRFETGQIIECTVRAVQYYGVHVNVSESQSGLLRINRIHSKYVNSIYDWFHVGQKLNLAIFSHIDDKIELSQVDLINRFLIQFKTPNEVNVKIRSVVKNNIFILINDLYDYSLNIEDLIISENINLSEINMFNCLFYLENHRLIISSVKDISFKRLPKPSNEVYVREIQHFMTEQAYIYEEVINDIDDIDSKIDSLNWCKIIYSQFSNHRSYFIDYYLSYFLIIRKFLDNDSCISLVIQEYINKVEQDNKIKDSFKIIDKLKTILNILFYFNVVTEESFIYLSKMYLADDYKNIARLVMLNNLNDSTLKKSNYKEKIYKFLLLNSKLTEIQFTFEDLNESEEDDFVLTELLSIIKKGENKYVEFKSTLKTPIGHDGSIVLNFNADALIHEVMKNIVGFVNSKGGKLFIGVSDSGNIIGLEPDFSKFYDKVDKNDRNKLIDKYLQTLDHHIEDWIGNEIRKHIDVNIHTWKGKDFCVININEKENNKPFMVNHSFDKNKNQTIKNQRECYIRTESGSKKLSVEDIIKIFIHF
jgi:predicted RNA-binding protein with RPS1 domain